MSKMIALPFIIATGVILYYLFFEDRAEWYPWLFPLVIILAVIYTFHPKIDFWWHQKYPPAMSDRLLDLVHRSSDFFRKLDDQEKKKFLDRLSIFIHHKAFYLMRKEKEQMPVDMQTLIAINAVTLTLGSKNFFFDKYDYFFAYQHPFPTPFRQQLHSVEVNHEDGVMLFDAELLFRHMVMGQAAFNIGLYAFAESLLVSEPLSALAQAEEPDPSQVNKFSKINLERIISETGYKELYPKAVLVSLYFTYPEDVKLHYPVFFRECESFFNNPHRSLS